VTKYNNFQLVFNSSFYDWVESKKGLISEIQKQSEQALTILRKALYQNAPFSFLLF